MFLIDGLMEKKQISSRWEEKSLYVEMYHYC